MSDRCKCFFCYSDSKKRWYLTWVWDDFHLCNKCWDKYCDGDIDVWSKFRRVEAKRRKEEEDDGDREHTV